MNHPLSLSIAALGIVTMGTVSTSISTSASPRTLPSEAERLRIENAQLRLTVAGLESTVERLEARLAACEGEAEPGSDDSPIWATAISLAVRSVEPIGLLPEEEREIARIRNEIASLRESLTSATQRADTMVEENRRANQPKYTWDGEKRRQVTPTLPHSQRSISAARGEVARLENAITRNERAQRRLERAGTDTRVVIDAIDPDLNNQTRRVMLTGRPAVEALDLDTGDLIDVRLAPGGSLTATDTLEGINFRYTPETDADNGLVIPARSILD